MAEIKFPAEINKVQTLADGGIRVTLDLPETEIPVMAMLAECKRQGIYLRFTAKEYEQNDDGQQRTDRQLHI
jgi:hypothetical protein